MSKMDPPSPETPGEVSVDRLMETIAGAHEEVARVIIGQDRVIRQVLVTLLCGGHGMLVGVPGVGKTRLVETIARVCGLDSKRIQCTPDLMPGDILGSEVLDETVDGQRSFRFLEGPVFTQLLMADEINRASPRSQSALLQAMQERTVTTGGVDRPLPAPFHVLATRNPIEHEGTYPLPEAQLDRFLMEIHVDQLDRESERNMVLMTTGGTEITPQARMDAGALLAGQALVSAMPVPDQVLDAIINLIRSARPDREETLPGMDRLIHWGPGPRAGQALSLACRAHALLEGRMAPSVEDVLALAAPVLQHRMQLSFLARADGWRMEHVLDALCRPFR